MSDALRLRRIKRWLHRGEQMKAQRYVLRRLQRERPVVLR